MVNTATQAFNTFKSNLEITDLQSGTVSARQRHVRGVLDSEMNVLDTFLAGSYMRDTMIAPLAKADIDIFVVLHPDYYSVDGQASLLDKTKRVLRKEFTRTPEISRNGQAVTITFTDFKVDVVPGFNRQGGGYLIPNSKTGSWISTDPKVHISKFSQANKDNKSRLKPLIKMLKSWNRNISFGFSNFHIEAMAYEIFENTLISDYPSGVRYFFDKAKDDVRGITSDPAGYSTDVGAYLNTHEKIEKAVSNLTTAYNRALKAEAFARVGKISEAIAEWKKIFGDRFPSYG